MGSRWVDVTNNKEYVCLDASTGAAVWTETTGAGGGASTFVALGSGSGSGGLGLGLHLDKSRIIMTPIIMNIIIIIIDMISSPYSKSFHLVISFVFHLVMV